MKSKKIIVKIKLSGGTIINERKMKQETLSAILNVAKKTGDKYIIVEDNQPKLVVMGFKEYQKLALEKEDDTNEFQSDPESFEINSQDSKEVDAKDGLIPEEIDDTDLVFQDEASPFLEESKKPEEPLYYFSEEKRD